MVPTTEATTTTTTSPATTSSSGGESMTAEECWDLAANSQMANAELAPYLRTIGCDEAADGLHWQGDEPADVDYGEGVELGPWGPAEDHDDPSTWVDMNGETYADYCERTGQSVESCDAS
jgi:hypothetical protein